MRAATRYYTEKNVISSLLYPFRLRYNHRTVFQRACVAVIPFQSGNDVIAGLKIVLRPCVTETKQQQAIFLNLWPRAYHFSPYSHASLKRTVNDFNYNPFNFYIEQARYVYDNKGSKIDCKYFVGGKESHLYPQCNCASE